MYQTEMRIFQNMYWKILMRKPRVQSQFKIIDFQSQPPVDYSNYFFFVFDGFRFSFTLNFTILVISSDGIGLLSGN
jgi:hypothetical protein